MAENPYPGLPAAERPRLLLAFTQDAVALQPLQALAPLVQPPERLHIAYPGQTSQRLLNDGSRVQNGMPPLF